MGIGWIPLYLSACGLLITGISAFVSGVTIKTILFRSLISGLIIGLLGFFVGAWLEQRSKAVEGTVAEVYNDTGRMVDIRISDDEDVESELKPLQLNQLSGKDVRVFPAQK
jgi:hypothetical protein